MKKTAKKYSVSILGMGATGSVIARFLQKDNEIKEIKCFVQSTEKAKEFLPDGLKKISIRKISLPGDKSKFIKEISNSNLLINAASYKINTDVMDAAFKAKVNYFDLASYFIKSPHVEQFDFDKKFKDFGLKGLIDAGAAPGISNLLVAEMALYFDSIDNIKLRYAEQISSLDIVSSWSPELAIEELSAKIPVFKNGRFSFKKPFSEEEIYNYPPPFGKLPATLICQDELVTIPLFIKTKNMDAKSGGSDIESMKIFYNLGFFSKKTISINGRKIRMQDILLKIVPPTPSPKEMTSMINKGRVHDARFGIFVEMEGKKKRKNLTKKGWVIFPSIFEIQKLMPGATYISYPTGLAAYLFIKNLKNADFKGVLPPEGLDHKVRAKILNDLKKYAPATKIKN